MGQRLVPGKVQGWCRDASCSVWLWSRRPEDRRERRREVSSQRHGEGRHALGSRWSIPYSSDQRTPLVCTVKGTYVGANNVSDAHEMVIHDIGEMVCREPVGFQQHCIFATCHCKVRRLAGRSSPAAWTINKILILRIDFRRIQSNGEWFPMSSPLGRFCGIDLLARSLTPRASEALAMLCYP